MALRPEYSLGHSRYNDFLFASIGEEKTGTLTVLSALTRLGFDHGRRQRAWRTCLGLQPSNRSPAPSRAFHRGTGQHRTRPPSPPASWHGYPKAAPRPSHP